MADQKINTSSPEIPYGFCQCGCGKPTQISKVNCKPLGYIKGEPIRFLVGHNIRGEYGVHNRNWKGGRVTQGHKYIRIKLLEHPRANNGYVLEHITVVEEVMGKYLPPSAVVHHINGDTSDNRPMNLIVCEDENYHRLIHQRMRAFKVCGHADWLHCLYCKQFDKPINLYVHPKRKYAYHRKCKAIYYNSYA